VQVADGSGTKDAPPHIYSNETARPRTDTFRNPARFCEPPHSRDANGVLNYNVEIQGLWQMKMTLDQKMTTSLYLRTFR